MPSQIVPALVDLFPDVIVATPGSNSGYGTFIASGATVSIPCRISDGARMVRDQAGREVVSSVRVITAGMFSLNARSYRYSLPARYAPGTSLTATAVQTISDENGPHHQIVNFP